MLYLLHILNLSQFWVFEVFKNHELPIIYPTFLTGHFCLFSYLGDLQYSDIEKQNMTPPILQSEAPAHPINRAAPNSYLWRVPHKC